MPIPAEKEDLQRLTAKDRIYQIICDWIITGVLKPGEKILDTELAAHFNVSRTPVREAIQMLERQKLVCVIPSRGTVVTEMDVNDIEKAYLPLAEIQGLAAEIACQKLTAGDLAEMDQILAKFAVACKENDVDTAIALDNGFHKLILRAADNEYISEFSETLILHIQRIKYHYFHYDPLRKTSLAQHRQIFEAFQAYDGMLAHQRMREHWLFVMNRSLKDVYEATVAPILEQEKGTL